MAVSAMPSGYQHCHRQSPFESYAELLLVLTTWQYLSCPLQYLLEVLIYCERNSLTGSDTHDTRCDTLVETTNALLLPHVADKR